ncbi:MAG: hypothetical protein HYU79_05290 [Nitrosomonadales bacterium]|nr:hypothetical protein [Nitrosomonadales bacterium]
MRRLKRQAFKIKAMIGIDGAPAFPCRNLGQICSAAATENIASPGDEAATATGRL